MLIIFTGTMEALKRILLGVFVITLTLSLIEACPMNCNCGTYRTVICDQISSLKSISADIPPETNVLEINNGRFYSIGETDFEEMPTKNLLQLKIRNGQLSEIKPNAFQHLTSLQVLDLSRNTLQQINSPDLFSGLFYLQHMDLSENSLNDLPSGVFSAQSNLKELKISGNKNIRNLRGPSFQGLRTLNKFLASGCGIRTLESDLFSAISAINTLDLSYNQIQSLPTSDSFRLLHNLRNLTLQGNKISTLTDSQFAGMDLDILDLSGNVISSISPNTFMYLIGARNLDLSHNRINTFPSFVFQPIAPEVYTLRLNDNFSLRKLPVDLFRGMRKMNLLNLSSCTLETLQEELFQQDFNTGHIDISNNWIKHLPQSFIDRAKFMQHVKITNNPWHCDCLIKPLYNWLQFPQASSILYCSAQPQIGFSTNCPLPRCSSPQNLENREISRLMPKDLDECENTGASSSAPVSIIVGVLAGLLVIVIIIIIVACCLYRRHKRGDPLLCYEPAVTEEYVEKKKKHREPNNDQKQKKHKKEPKTKRGDRDYYREKKEKRRIDPESSSLNESDKSFVVRNFFHSMMPDPDGASEGTQSQSMTRKDSVESLSQYGYNSRAGSRHSSQYSLNAGIKIESAV